MYEDHSGFINWAALDEAVVKETPFPYFVIPNFINSKYLASLVEAFPAIDHRGSFPVSAVKSSSLFQKFIQELEGSQLRLRIAEKFDMPLHRKATMLTLRGQTTERDGKIHTDSKSKLVTLLLYMNQYWTDPGGQLRLLNSNHSLEDYVEEISPVAGTCLIFKVTDNCWHGHKPFVGKRLSLQLNYLADEKKLLKQLYHHRLSAFLKRKFPRLFQSSEYY